MSTIVYFASHRGSLSTLALVWLFACAPADGPRTESAKAAADAAKSAVSPSRGIWWTDATFVPADTVVNGLPVATIDSSWMRASPLSFALLPASARDDLSLLADTTSAGFARDADFDADGVIDRALAGVYVARDGAAGRFLIVLSPAASSSPRVAFKATMQPGAGFSVLTFRSGTLQWATCMECDDIHELRWVEGRYMLEYMGPSEESEPDSVAAPHNGSW